VGPKTAPSSLSCIDIAGRVAKRDGFWFAAHAVGVSGILRLSKDGGGLTHIWCACEDVLALPYFLSGETVVTVEHMLDQMDFGQEHAAGFDAVSG